MARPRARAEARESMKNIRHPSLRASLLLMLVIATGCRFFSPGDLARGGLLNLNVPTLGGRQLWADVAWSDGWRVQRHVWSRHHRLLDAQDTRRAWGGEAYCKSLLPPEQAGELVVLLHGLGRTRFSFKALEERLEAQGHEVLSLAYPSTRATLDQHAKSVEQVLNGLETVERVSFVTHSLGGRVVLRLLERKGEWSNHMEVGRIVQIAPPNRGSSLAARLVGVPFLAAVLGPAFLEVAERSTQRPPSDCAVGVIAGTQRVLFGWNPLLAGGNDGLVTLGETCAEFPHEHLSVIGLHTFLMEDDQVIAATIRFLERGRFER